MTEHLEHIRNSAPQVDDRHLIDTWCYCNELTEEEFNACSEETRVAYALAWKLATCAPKLLRRYVVSLSCYSLGGNLVIDIDGWIHINIHYRYDKNAELIITLVDKHYISDPLKGFSDNDLKTILA